MSVQTLGPVFPALVEQNRRKKMSFKKSWCVGGCYPFVSNKELERMNSTEVESLHGSYSKQRKTQSITGQWIWGRTVWQQPGRPGRFPLHPCMPSDFTLSLPMQGGHTIREGTFPLRLIFGNSKGHKQYTCIIPYSKNTNSAYCVSWLQAVFL